MDHLRRKYRKLNDTPLLTLGTNPFFFSNACNVAYVGFPITIYAPVLTYPMGIVDARGNYFPPVFQ